MVFHGQIRDGAIVLDEPVVLPEGARVKVAVEEKPDDRVRAARSDASLEDQLAAIWRDVPPEEWTQVPADLTDHLDHYIYGSPRP